MFWRDPAHKEDRLKFKLTAKIVLMYHECCRNSLSHSYSSYKKKKQTWFYVCYEQIELRIKFISSS